MAAYEKKTGGQLIAIRTTGTFRTAGCSSSWISTASRFTKEYAEEAGAVRGVAGDHPDQGQQRDAPDDVAERRVRGRHGGRGLGIREPVAHRQPAQARDDADQLPAQGLLRGLEQEATLGANPFKFGFVGSTDVHNSLTAIEEDNFFGKMPNQEPRPNRWEHESKKSSWDGKLGPERARYTWQEYLAAGYAAVWATENTRAGDLGRDEAPRGLRHVRLAHDRAVLRRMGLRARRREVALPR